MYENVPKDKLSVVGKDTRRVDVLEKVTGAALYTGDFKLPGMLHAKLKKSPHARAKIVNIDLSKAKRLPGVHAILTGKELDYLLGLYLVDKHVLAKDMVRHFGEAVVAVAAETEEIADLAVELIEVE
jgi:CO/xanthine dehydrogenase Mo-binding subunit